MEFQGPSDSERELWVKSALLHHNGVVKNVCNIIAALIPHTQSKLQIFMPSFTVQLWSFQARFHVFTEQILPSLLPIKFTITYFLWLKNFTDQFCGIDSNQEGYNFQP